MTVVVVVIEVEAVAKKKKLIKRISHSHQPLVITGGKERSGQRKSDVKEALLQYSQ